MRIVASLIHVEVVTALSYGPSRYALQLVVMVSNNLKRDSALVGYGIQPGTVWSFLVLLLEVESLVLQYI